MRATVRKNETCIFAIFGIWKQIANSSRWFYVRRGANRWSMCLMKRWCHLVKRYDATEVMWKISRAAQVVLYSQLITIVHCTYVRLSIGIPMVKWVSLGSSALE
jgi:hypothetical protein